MTRELAIGLAALGLVWTGSMVWLVGYRSGFEDGSDSVMTQVERWMPTMLAEGRDLEKAEQEALPLPTEL